MIPSDLVVGGVDMYLSEFGGRGPGCNWGGEPGGECGIEMEPPWGVKIYPDLFANRGWAGSLGVEVWESVSGEIPGVRQGVNPANGPGAWIDVASCSPGCE